jgi:hypothetical protein
VVWQVHWYTAALILGMATPWALVGRSILGYLTDGQVLTALAMWLVACVLTVPPMFAVIGLCHWLRALAVQ